MKKPILAILALILATVACVQPILLTVTPTLPTPTATKVPTLYATVTLTPSPTLAGHKALPVSTPKK